jgi:hypothetical protein
VSLFLCALLAHRALNPRAIADAQRVLVREYLVIPLLHAGAGNDVLEP